MSDPFAAAFGRNEPDAFDAAFAGEPKKPERTILNPLEEPGFLAWAKRSNITDPNSANTDYRAQFKTSRGKPLPLSVPFVPTIRERAAAQLAKQGTSLEAEIAKANVDRAKDAAARRESPTGTRGAAPREEIVQQRLDPRPSNFVEVIKEDAKTSMIPTAIAGIENMSPDERKAAAKKILLAAGQPLQTVAAYVRAASSPGYKAGAANLRETAAMANKGDPDSVGAAVGHLVGPIVTEPVFFLQPNAAVPKLVELGIARRIGTEAAGQLVQMLAKAGASVPAAMLLGTVDALVKSGEIPSVKDAAKQGAAAIAFGALMHISGNAMHGSLLDPVTEGQRLASKGWSNEQIATQLKRQAAPTIAPAEIGNVPPELAAAHSGADLNAPSEPLVPRGPEARVADVPVAAEQRIALRRKPIAEMTMEERGQALLTNQKSGLPSEVAWEEMPRRAHEAIVDLDNFKRVNDDLGHDTGDSLLRVYAQHLKMAADEVGADVAHLHGDEVKLQHDDPAALTAALERAQETLRSAKIEYVDPDGRIADLSDDYRRGFSYGIGEDSASADAALQANKRARFEAGLRDLRVEPGTAPVANEAALRGGSVEAGRNIPIDTAAAESAQVTRPLREVWTDLEAAHNEQAAAHDRIYGQLDTDSTGAITPRESRSPMFARANRERMVGEGRIEPSQVIPENEMNAMYARAEAEWRPYREKVKALELELDAAAAREGQPPVSSPPGGEPPRINANADTGGDTVGPSKPTVPLDWAAYVQDRVAKTEAAKTSGKLTLRERFQRGRMRSKAAVVDFLSPLEDPVREAHKKLGITALPSRDLTNALDGSIKAAVKARAHMRGNGFNSIIQEVPSTDEFGQFLLSRHAKALKENGHNPGSGIVDFQKIPESVKVTYEPYAKRMDAYLRSLLEYRVKMGTVTREYADLVNEMYPEYVPFDRVFGENEVPVERGHGAGHASLSKQTTDLKMVGSERIAENPLHSIFEKTVNAYNEGERNFAASIVADEANLQGNPLGLRLLRGAGNVRKRLAIIKDLAAIGRESRAMRRAARTTDRTIAEAGGVVDRMFARVDKRIASEAEESQAVYDAMRTHAADFADDHATDGMLANSLSAEKNILSLQERYETLSTQVENLTRNGTGIYEAARVAAGDGATPQQVSQILDAGLRNEMRKVGAEARQMKAAERYDQTSAADFRVASRAAEDVNLDKMDALESRGLRAERNLYGLQGQREQIDFSHAAERLSELKQTAKALDIAINERSANVKKMRSELFTLRDALRKPSDDTFSYLKDGVRETWAAPEPIVAAMKGLNVEQMQTWMSILGRVSRMSKTLMTGVNLGFLASNPVKDLPSSIVNSEAGFRVVTHMWRGLKEAIGHGEFHDAMAARGGEGTSFDIFRPEPKMTLAKIRSQRSIAASGAYILTHPKDEWLRFVEDIIGRTEEFGRLTAASAEQARLLKTEAIKNSANPQEEALLGAVRAFLWNTAPFHRHGEIKALRVLGPYLPSGIQGNRVTLGALRDNTRATAIKLGVLSIPVWTVTAWNISDPRRKAVYDNVKEYEKENSLVIVGNDAHLDPKTNRWIGVYKWPLQQNLAKFATMVRRPMEAYAGLDQLKFVEMAEALLGVASPISTPSEAVTAGMVHAVKPLMETQIGQGGTDIFRNSEIEPRFLWDKPPEERVRENTSGTARLLARPFGAGPMKTEYLFSGYGGGGGRQILNASDRALAAVGVIPKEQIAGTDPLSAMERRFSGASAMTPSEIEKRDKTRQGSHLTPAQQKYLDQLMAKP